MLLRVDCYGVDILEARWKDTNEWDDVNSRE